MSRIPLSGSTLVFLGALFWSLSSPLVKYLTLPALLICGLRSVIAGIALCPTIRPRQLRWNRWLVFYLLSYLGLCVSVILALSMTSAPIAVGMQYTATIWLFLIGLLRTRRFRWRAFLPVFIISVGVVFFMCSSTGGTNRLGNFIALTEGIFFVCITISSQKAAGTNPLGLTALANLFTGLAVFLVVPGLWGELAKMSPRDWVLMLILGVVQVGGGYGCFNLGVQKVSAQRASIIALWEMILGPLWVALFLGEYPSPLVLIGFVFILVGIVLDNLPSGKAQSQDCPS